MNPADLAAELDRRQRVIDDLRAQLAAADAENRRLRAHLDWWQDWGQCLRGTLPESEWTLNNQAANRLDPEHTLGRWDEANLGGGTA